MIAIIGGGHAGVEAALAASRLNVPAVLFTLNLDFIANLPCNPSIGGSAKGHLVREIDALGGEMAKSADKALIQARMLGKSKGASIHSPRAQADRRKYSEQMKFILEQQDNLKIIQAEVVKIEKIKDRWQLITAQAEEFIFDAVILATGTYLDSRIISGEYVKKSGPDNSLAACELTSSLKDLGLNIMRFKTGTPPRIAKSTIDFSQLEMQEGDNPPLPFSFQTKDKLENKVQCHICYTNEETHKIIKDNLHRAPMYSGVIKGTGARYCPSIEDKVVRFADKLRHQLFVEPMGLATDEIYLQGLSTSMPAEIQKLIVRSIKGLENAEIMRYAYAIEYDCVDPLELKPSLEYKKCPGIFGAGQINGTSGYEEAAAQGLIAGINAAHYIFNKQPLILARDEAYIGVLIDDLVNKGTNEPYRIMTARSEYRLLLRQDNADKRLMQKGYDIGLISQETYDEFKDKWQKIDEKIKYLQTTSIKPVEINEKLKSLGTTEINQSVKIAEILKRPEVHLKDLGIDCENAETIETEIKYEGYLLRQESEAKSAKKMENKKIPTDIDYSKIKGLRIEAMQKLDKVRPESIGSASRISGVNPADIAVLLVYLK